jgi:hypothetical protein
VLFDQPCIHEGCCVKSDDCDCFNCFPSLTKMFRLSFRGAKAQQEPELDFRPSRKSMPSAQETTSFEKLAEAERVRWTQGGGGAVIGDVEWVPDPVTGGQRALFRPVSSKIMENTPTTNGQNTDIKEGEVGVKSETTKDDENRNKRLGRPGEDRMAGMTPEQRAEHAKRVIEGAIEAERAALEKKMAPKKRG